jgi:two-component system, response regulator PdtaR
VPSQLAPSPIQDTISAPRPLRARPAFAQDKERGSAAQPAQGGGILIVEDDFLIAAQMEGALQNAGFQIAGIAASAAEALEYAASEHPLLCVMDVRLFGDRDGVDAALDLFRTYGIRCIFATAHSDDDVRGRAAAADPLGWLPKPYTMASLIRLVRRAVSELRGETD